MRDPRWREARKKVKVIVHPEWSDDGYTFDSPVTIVMKDGRKYQKICHDAGRPDNHRSGAEDAMKKYLDCVDFAGTFSRARAEQIAEMILALDKMEDISPLAALLTYPDQV